VKESKFIELLNLYIDQQISPEDAALMEEEILHDPQRRRTYRQYCQMHRACTLVFADAPVQAGAGEEETARIAGQVIELAPRPRRFGWGYYAAGLAAAACVALVAVRVFRGPSAPSAQIKPATVVAASANSGPALTAVSVRLDAPSTGGYGLQTAAFVADRLTLFSPIRMQNSTSLVIVNRPAERMPLRPLSAAKNAPAAARPNIEQFVFEQPSPAPGTPPVFRVRQTGDTQGQMAAYQFQR
jgi:hypothetical protein